MRYLLSALVVFALLVGAPALAQQTGSISGTVTDANGEALPGVAVDATSDVMPRGRSAVSNAAGEYRLELLLPGEYELSFSMEGLASLTRRVRVRLQQSSLVDVVMQPEAIAEEVEVVATADLIDLSSAELKSAIDNQVIERLPVGQDYRDIIKLIPGVQYTEDSVRGPSAGGSGQDNVYLFDGVNVGLPLFGVLSAEPSSHDIDQVAIVKGGAKALDFNRSGGFTINTVSKSGTNQFHGQVSYQIQPEDLTGDRDTGSEARFQEDKDWTTAAIGGPIASDNLYFYASYYRPTVTRDSRSNFYGNVPDLDNERDELFGKLTWTPANSLLFNVSYRDSDRSVAGASVLGEADAGSTSVGEAATLGIAIAEGSWVASPKSFLSFKVTDFDNETQSRPDNLFDFDLALDGSVGLDVDNLETQGQFFVPTLRPGEDAYNAFVTPIIERYGYLENGMRVGGGVIGGHDEINRQDFFREGWEVSYDYLLGTRVSHELHFGYQWSSDEEELARISNGWGEISVPGGRVTTTDGEPIFYEAVLLQQTFGAATGVPPIVSDFEQQSIEVNDTIRLDRWTFNVGLMASNDELFGQGLRENPGNVSGFEVNQRSRYLMKEVDFDETIAPRLGAIWSYNDRDTVYANYARYYPAASSLPRAASWARSLTGFIVEASFDENGNLIFSEMRGSSSGKFFADDLDPRFVDEFLIGTSRQLTRRWTGKAHARYRYGANFWEDVPNDSRLYPDAPDSIPQELYIPNLQQFRDEVGGSSYVIGELDGAFTKYYEVSLDGEWRSSDAYFKGSYVWSHYYGNFDQDNTSAINDMATFIGSSNFGDGGGRQVWNNQYGNLRGDRRHQLKLYGYYNFSWNGSAGVYAIAQSGQPWEIWDVEFYRDLLTAIGSSSTSDTARFAEPAGSRRTSSHYQVDLNYTQNFRLGDRYNVRVRADLFNVLDKQTGYDIEPRVGFSNLGEPRDFFDPRRLQILVGFQF
jgi:hypothetical protein